MIFLPPGTRKFLLFPVFPPVPPYICLFSINNHIFSPTNQYFTFCPPPPGTKLKIYTPEYSTKTEKKYVFKI